MTTELKRYSLIHDPEYQSQMLQRHDGKYVRFADVQGVIKSAIAIGTTDPAAIRESALREAKALAEAKLAKAVEALHRIKDCNGESDLSIVAYDIALWTLAELEKTE